MHGYPGGSGYRGSKHYPGYRDSPGGAGRCRRQGEPPAHGNGPAGQGIPCSGQENSE